MSYMTTTHTITDRHTIPWRDGPSLDGRTWTTGKAKSTTPRKLKNVMLPAPVFEAHYADGVVIRMSFATEEGKPFNLARGRAVCDRAYANLMYVGSRDWANPYGGDERHPRDEFIANAKPVLVKAFTEHKGLRNGVSLDTVTEKRATPKTKAADPALDCLRDLLTWAEFMGGFDASIWDRAAAIVAKAEGRT